MVRLKGFKAIFEACGYMDFNSSMVRLKGKSKFGNEAIEIDFNSSMVRLKVIGFNPVFVVHLISIPLWCD